jgi:hypothetical protein
MRRDYFTVTTRTPAETDAALDRPTIEVGYAGPADELQDALTDDAGEPLPASAIDVTCRLQDAGRDGDCVLALTHRLTGEFLLEANAAASDVLDLAEAARDAGEGEGCYRVRLAAEEGEDRVYDVETLLVYDADGNLLRGRSLIPSGVEL